MSHCAAEHGHHKHVSISLGIPQLAVAAIPLSAVATHKQPYPGRMKQTDSYLGDKSFLPPSACYAALSYLSAIDHPQLDL
jgi:hypothetical protein